MSQKMRQEKFLTVSSLYVLICFKYFTTNSLKKSDKKSFKLYQIFMC